MKQKILDLIIAAKRTDQETGSFAEWLAEYLAANGVTVQEWIPVEERTPKEGEKVLCINKKGNMFVAYHSKSLNDLFVLPEFPMGHKGLRRATHWMPLPEHPRKDVIGDGC